MNYSTIETKYFTSEGLGGNVAHSHQHFENEAHVVLFQTTHSKFY